MLISIKNFNLNLWVYLKFEQKAILNDVKVWTLLKSIKRNNTNNIKLYFNLLALFEVSHIKHWKQGFVAQTAFEWVSFLLRHHTRNQWGIFYYFKSRNNAIYIIDNIPYEKFIQVIRTCLSSQTMFGFVINQPKKPSTENS